MRAGRWRRAPFGIAAAVSLVLLAAGCSGRATGATGAAEPAGPSTLAGYYAQRLDWQPCDDGFECARLLVPFDYGRPDGRRFSLPVVKLPAAEASRRIGALVINPGGPGGSGVQYALGARSELPAALRARFDIVGFDPRGVGGSVHVDRFLVTIGGLLEIYNGQRGTNDRKRLDEERENEPRKNCRGHL